MNNQVIVFFMLAAASFFGAFVAWTPTPVPTPSYHVAYTFENGGGATTLSFTGPLTAARITEMRDVIREDLKKNHGKESPVVITAVIPLSP